jgi:hypothetical protein
MAGSGVLLGTALVGCAAPPPAPVPAGYVAPVSAFDGNYQGRVRLIAGRPPLCPRPHTGVLEVGDRALTFAYAPDVIFTTPVAPDGSLHQQIGAAVLDGRIAGEHLSVTITSPGCSTRYDMAYVWNHSSTAPVPPQPH